MNALEEKIIENWMLLTLGAKTYSSFTKSDYNGVELYFYTLQFYKNGWIYGYSICNRNMDYPMYVMKGNKVCMVNSEEELHKVGQMILNGDNSFLTHNIKEETKHNLSPKQIEDIVKNNVNVLYELQAVFSDDVYIYSFD